ncbi:MAG: hypothetical protein FJ095_10815 [Deltaproteobacteria bacterium]|nr:hypothetical protein [Deltaproteobacteria bacterium]
MATRPEGEGLAPDEPLDPYVVPWTFDERGHLRNLPAVCEATSVALWDPVEREHESRRGRPDEHAPDTPDLHDEGSPLDGAAPLQRP